MVMDFTKKRKLDDNGGLPVDTSLSPIKLAVEDVRKIIEPFTHEQLIEIVQNAAVRHIDVLDLLRSIADKDPTQRKLFIRGLGWDTTSENLRSLFSTYGELDEAIVILDKVTGKSKGFGFITFTHVDGALLALNEPSKKIDGRMTVTQLAASGVTAPTANVTVAVDSSARKIYVGNVPPDMSVDRLLGHFSAYGEIEEGPLGLDKATGKFRGWTLFVFKTADAARAALVDPIKNINGHQLNCKLANEGKRGKPGGTVAAAQSVQGLQNGVPAGAPKPHGNVSGVYSGVGAYSGGVPQPSSTSHNPVNSSMRNGQGLPFVGGVQMLSSVASASNNPMSSSMGGTPGLPSVGGVPALSSFSSQALPPSSVGPISGYGGPYGGSHFVGHGLVSYGGVAGAPMGAAVASAPTGASVAGAPMGGGVAGVPMRVGVAGASMGGAVASVPMGGAVAGAQMGGGVVRYGGSGQGASLHVLPQNSGGVPSRKSAHYSLSSSGFQQTEGLSSGPRIPTGGILHGSHPYYRGE